MAVAVMDIGDRTVIYDSDADILIDNDVAGGPCTLHRVHINNQEASIEMCKLYDAVAPTAGTTEPVEIYECSSTKEKSFDVNPPDGLRFENGLSVGAASEGGKTMTTAPGTNMLVILEVEVG